MSSIEDINPAHANVTTHTFKMIKARKEKENEIMQIERKSTLYITYLFNNAYTYRHICHPPAYTL